MLSSNLVNDKSMLDSCVYVATYMGFACLHCNRNHLFSSLFQKKYHMREQGHASMTMRWAELIAR